MQFHRLVVPMREAVSGLMRREQTAIDEDMYPYYQDVYDHVLRVSESTDALRDLVSTIVETNLSLRDYRPNQIMKKVTSWAAIIAVPTLITGWYGMNVPYPGSGETWGVWAAARSRARAVGGALRPVQTTKLAVATIRVRPPRERDAFRNRPRSDGERRRRCRKRRVQPGRTSTGSPRPSSSEPWS